MKKKDYSRHTLSVSVTNHEKDAIQRFAYEHYMDVSKLVRSVVLDYIDKERNKK